MWVCRLGVGWGRMGGGVDGEGGCQMHSICSL